jgi:hypothetical protein
MQEALMRRLICRLMLIGTLGFSLVFVAQEQLDLASTFQSLSALSVLVAIGGVVLAVWTHFTEWRRPMTLLFGVLLGVAAVAAVVMLPELRASLGQLFSGISLEGSLPLVSAVMCLITYGALGIAHAPSSSN